MFKYLVCLCVVGVAYAGGAGYNYASASVPEPQVLQAPPPAPVTASLVAPVSAPQFSDGAPQASYQQVQYVAPVQESVKHFYHFNAPEEQSVQLVHQQPQATQTVKKHLNVVFIQAPETKVHQKVRQVVNNVVEETKTHIYVLNKEPSHVAPKQIAATQQVTHYSHKPEVHFVKYRTPAEGYQKQQQIVQQYGGGQVISLGGGGAGGAGGFQNVATNVNRQYLAPPNNGYIPPPVFF